MARADELFTQHVAPILEQRCLDCHSGQEPAGVFSLESADALTASGYVVPGDPQASYLLEVITPRDGTAYMPKDGAPCSQEELDAIRRWIESGADWPSDVTLAPPRVDDYQWWSFEPLTRPDIPHVDSDWPANTIDRFILAKLRQQGLSPSPQADRRTLIRRVTYDLTGLPPTPVQVRAFEQDPTPDAYERLVDRLLASKQYGQRWARHWLDVVKYADTCGYDKDKLRPNAWPYRDYVIRSFNDDKPYERFVQEQLAGDVLFPDDPDGIVALGFIAAGPWDFIGHVEVPESKIDGRVARNLDRDDMVSNALNTFSSLTVQCARCHHHKFDPISQEDYYSLQAIFAAVDRADRTYASDPDVEAERERLRRGRSRLREQLKEVDQQFVSAGGEQLHALEKELADLKSEQPVIKSTRFGFHSQLSDQADAEKWVRIDLGKPYELSEVIVHPCHDDFAGIGAGFGFPRRFLIEASADGMNWTALYDQTADRLPNPNLKPLRIEAHDQPVRMLRLIATELAERQDDYHLALAEIEARTATGENIALSAQVTATDSIEAPERWSRENLVDGEWARYAEPGVAERQRELQEERELLLADAQLAKLRAATLELEEQLGTLNDQLDRLPRGKQVYAASIDFEPQGNFQPTGGQPREIHVLDRGDVRSPGKLVEPNVLPLGPEIDERLTTSGRVETLDQPVAEGERRATLARWMTTPEHPLTWRSIVNRLWQYHFDRGLVTTPNDFGRMGAQPTHPELLDWLAVEFRDGGQSMKRLHRMIVTSSTYRQASGHREDQAARDASNQYLWRMPRRKLEAEEIRDSILAVSDRLDSRMGGPGFQLFELSKTEHSPHFEYHRFDPDDPASHRRSIYRFIVRSQPAPWMTTLDCADSSQSTPKRNETLTSLQALVLLNNKFNLSMGRHFAHRLRREAEGVEQQVDRAIWLIAQRPPNDAEAAELTAYAEAHGLENLCRLLFNLSEFIFVD